MNEEKSGQFGYLRTCMDKRFVDATRKLFEAQTGLKPTEYWHESNPGGSALEIDPTGEDYAHKHGATIFGWQAHIDGCGGQPGIDNETIAKRLDTVITKKKEKFPASKHFRILASENEISMREI